MTAGPGRVAQAPRAGRGWSARSLVLLTMLAPVTRRRAELGDQLQLDEANSKIADRTEVTRARAVRGSLPPAICQLPQTSSLSAPHSWSPNKRALRERPARILLTLPRNLLHYKVVRTVARYFRLVVYRGRGGKLERALSASHNSHSFFVSRLQAAF